MPVCRGQRHRPDRFFGDRSWTLWVGSPTKAAERFEAPVHNLRPAINGRRRGSGCGCGPLDAADKDGLNTRILSCINRLGYIRHRRKSTLMNKTGLVVLAVLAASWPTEEKVGFHFRRGKGCDR